jgi:hypothetical protein
MSHRAAVTLCILWEDELRTASRLLQIANDMPDDAQDRLTAIQQAWGACSVALAGLSDEKTVVMLGSDAIRIKKVAKK